MTDPTLRAMPFEAQTTHPAGDLGRRLRLMHVTHDLDVGGLQQVILNICRTIDRTRFDVSVLCLRTKGRFAGDIEALGIPVHLLAQKHSGVDYFAFLKVARLLRLLQIDVIHTHNTQPFIDGTLGAVMAGIRTVVHTDHARNFPDKTRYMLAERLLSTFAYRVVACSDHTARQLLEYEKISPRKMVTILNGIDGTRFDVSIDKFSKRRELGLPVDGQVIGLAARLSHQKGITYLLRAMPAILREQPATTLLIVGDGELGDDLKSEVVALGISEQVVFSGVRKDIADILGILDIYVLPSLWEGLPMVLLEAMAAGCPIVATNVGGSPSAVIDGKTGRLVEPANPEALSHAICELLASESLRRRYVDASRTFFRSTFTADKMTRQYERLYRREDG